MPKNLVRAIAVGDRLLVGRRAAHICGWQPLEPVTTQNLLLRKLSNRCAIGAAMAAAALISGCSAPAPKDFSGGWMPVNRFQTAPSEIPLSPAYTFYASPMDVTLQTMLKRWAADNGLQLNYQAGSDFTLYQPVSKIRTVEIQAAVGELSAIYATQRVAITADPKQILVKSTGAAQVTPGSR